MYTIQGRCPYAKVRDAKKAYIKFSKGIGSEVAEGEDSEELRLQKEREKQKLAEEKKQQEAQQRELLRKFVSKFPPKRIPNYHEVLEEERR